MIKSDSALNCGDWSGLGNSKKFSVLLPDQSHLQVEALEPTTVIRLTLDEQLRLKAKHHDFQLTMFRVSAHERRPASATFASG